MKSNTRKGNIVLAVVILIVLMTTFVSLLSINIAQKNNARAKASIVGDTNSYISMANICGWAFKDDLEAQSMKIVVADVSNPQGIEIGIEIFDTVISAFQQALQKNSAEPPTAPWEHTLETPYDAIDFTGITDDKATQHLQRILNNASVTTTINSTLSVIGAEDDTVSVKDGSSITITDILFDVVLTKGTWKITQSYRISGEKITMRLEGAFAVFNVDNTEATCTLEKQTVTRTFKNK